MTRVQDGAAAGPAAGVVAGVRPVAVLLLGYPLWWALGVQLPFWALAAAPVLVWLWLNRRTIVLPPGYGALLLFLGWVLASGLTLTTVRYAMAYGLRLVLYVAVVAIGIAVWNALRHGYPARRVVTWLVAFWAAAILLAYPGILVSNLEFTSPLEALLRALGIDDPFLTSLTHPEFSEYDQLYGAPRPSPLFAYTNDWGAAVGILLPVGMYAFVTAAGRREKVLLGLLLLASVPPVLVSLNRGCWITIGVALAWVVVQRALSGDLRPVAAVGATVAAIGATVVLVEPLRRALTARFEYGNTSTRATLYEASWDLALRSPLLGWGAPQSSEGLADSNDVSIGTHGQLWTILVSQGLVGLGLFVLAVLLVWWHARPASGAPEVWLHALGPALLVQIAFYEVLPVPLAVALLALAVCGTQRRRPTLPSHSLAGRLVTNDD
ncbi:O-antigen ligase family protein [Nocardioides zeae]|uniref:O-antigen ligase family protein n=1 Tax=Nocardioides imazamoxiresistens TaxID=3231893 RepID=A0ABU3PZ09_9ACTN|nr:O-antigen ligase family protein [Nocardioides zeae]MDT9594389.1 O-antigen ligase family protein [Nocardioides zeae]